MGMMKEFLINCDGILENTIIPRVNELPNVVETTIFYDEDECNCSRYAKRAFRSFWI